MTAHPTENEACPRCGQPHPILACPHVKSVEFADGHVFGGSFQPRISRVEFLTPSDFGAVRRVGTDAGAADVAYPTLGQEAGT